MLLLWGATACGGVPADAAAVVDGSAIPMDTLAEIVTGQDDGATAPDATGVGQSQRAVLSLLIQARVIEAAAHGEGVEVDEADVEAVIEEQAAALGGREQLRSRLERFGLSESRARDVIFRVLALETRLRETVTGGEPTPEEVRARFEERRGELAQVELRRIVVDSQSAALDLRSRLDQGADFAELASRESVDPASAARGGSLGSLLVSELPDVVRQAIEGARPGAVVGPLQLGDSWNLLQVVDRDDSPPFEAIRGVLAARLREERAATYEQFITDVFERAEIQVNPRLGKWDTTTRQVQAPTPPVGSTRGPGRPGGQLPAPGPAPAPGSTSAPTPGAVTPGAATPGAGATP